MRGSTARGDMLVLPCAHAPTALRSSAADLLMVMHVYLGKLGCVKNARCMVLEGAPWDGLVGAKVAVRLVTQEVVTVIACLFCQPF